MSNSVKWVWLAQKCGQGSTEVLTLVERFDSIESIYKADFEKYTDFGISERLAEDLTDKSLNEATKIVEYCRTADIGILCYDDAAYPLSLRSLKNPPAVLYYMGSLPDFNRRLCIAIVGTRKMSEYGMHTAYKIAYEVAASGAVVVSGMALGIDGIASCAAIAAKGTTVAVLGSGIDIIYPYDHATLEGIIKQNGAVISEYPPATEPKKTNFPMRNRIISGLCQGTAVIDADIDSGAMITAKNAILQGRDVYAVPGNIGAENTSGTNTLIRDGAQAVLCGRDIIRNYAYMYRDTLDITKLFIAEKKSDFDPNIVRNMKISTRVVSSFSDRIEDDGRHIGLTPAKESKAPEAEAGASVKKGEPKAKRREEAVDHRVHEKQHKSPDRLGDDSREVLEKLSEKQRKVLEEMPIDRAVTVDYLTKTGFALGEVISALTVLEIRGLVSSLPGALYIRK